MDEDYQPCILWRTDVAGGYDKRRNEEKTFRLGEIVHCFTDMNKLVLVKSADNPPEADREYWMISKECLLPFNKNFEEYLLPVKPFTDRLKLLEDVEICRMLEDLQKNDCVYVVLPEPHQSPDPTHFKNKKPAMVKYKGPIPEIEPAGIFFGLELLEPEDGDVDIESVGHSGFTNYFTCQPKSGLILTANQVLPFKYFCSKSNYKEQGRDKDCRLPFKVANRVAEQRANFENMPQSSYFSLRSMDHSDCIDSGKQKKSTFPAASSFSKSTEDFCLIGKSKPSYQRLEMDKTTSQPSRPGNLSFSKGRDVCTAHEYKNGHGTSPFSNELRYLSSDQLHKKDKKVENSFAEFPSSHSSSNFIQSGKTTPVNKINGGTNNMSSILSDIVDGYKGRTISRPVVINNSVDKPYSTTYRDDYGSNKLSKVNNSSVSNSVPSPIYSTAIHSVQSDPDLNRLSNNRDHFYQQDAEFHRVLSEPSEFEVGSVVEVDYGGKPRYGVIRWIEAVPENGQKYRIVGIETETEIEQDSSASDGCFAGTQYFKCHRRKGIFVNLSKCKKDKRFQENRSCTDAASKTFGFEDCPKIEGKVRPMSVYSKDLHKICGKPKGIQGHHNSCYLDATLFSMFTFTSVFDSLLYRPRESKDTPQYNEVQSVLRDEIVNPLRKNMFVRADRVMKLRTLLEKHSSVSGLTSEEKDPEEFLNSLVAQMLRAEPFLKLSSGQEAYYYQLFVEKDEGLEFPSVQNLFEQSFVASDIKLKEVPSCLIIQMPRFGKSFKMYPRILPSPILDVTDVIEDSPRQCHICGNLATFECKACMKRGTGGLESISFCENCLDRAHSHPECHNEKHECKELTTPYLFEEFPDTSIPRLYMELFAVVCIETSHYVTFVKCGDGPDAPWCFFDSMADRTGEQNGYNIPEVTAVPDLPNWLSEEGKERLQRIKDKELPERAKRLLCDAYMCMYRSSELQMYR